MSDDAENKTPASDPKPIQETTQNVEASPEKNAPETPSLLAALQDRLQYANTVLSALEERRILALKAKVPMEYQKSWRQDSGLFFSMAVKVNDRVKRYKHKIEMK